LAFSAQGKPLVLAVGWNKPPYIMASENAGYELELIRQVLRRMGHQLDPVYVPFGRSADLLLRGHVDLALTMNERLSIPSEQLSEVYIHYQNVAISLKSNSLEIQDVSDLRGHSIVAFQNASLLLGDQFSAAVSNSRSYVELPEQLNQVRMLLDNRTDVAVMDVNIFRYLASSLVAEPLSLVDIHRIFAVSDYRLGFNDRRLIPLFNRTLKAFMQSEAHAELLQQYQFIAPE
jgi:polar amino acid transport system substrate-binding protein